MKYGACREAVLLDGHPPLARAGYVLSQRQFDAALSFAPAAFYQGAVDLSYPPLPQLAMECRERGAPFRQQQYASGFTVEAVHQLQEARLRSFEPQLLHYAPADPAPAVNGDPGRLVDGQQMVVFVEDFGMQARDRP